MHISERHSPWNPNFDAYRLEIDSYWKQIFLTNYPVLDLFFVSRGRLTNSSYFRMQMFGGVIWSSRDGNGTKKRVSDWFCGIAWKCLFYRLEREKNFTVWFQPVSIGSWVDPLGLPRHRFFSGRPFNYVGFKSSWSFWTKVRSRDWIYEFWCAFAAGTSWSRLAQRRNIWLLYVVVMVLSYMSCRVWLVSVRFFGTFRVLRRKNCNPVLALLPILH